MTKMRGNIRGFWDERRKTALQQVVRVYKLKVGEFGYLKRAICQAETKGGMPPIVTVQLDTLAADLRLFFEHGCVEDQDDPALQTFVSVLQDEGRIRRHKEAWEAVRAREKQRLLREAFQTQI